MILLFGGIDRASEIFVDDEPRHLFSERPFWCFRPFDRRKRKLDRHAMGWVRLGALQICFVKPTVSLIDLVGQFYNRDSFPLLGIISFISLFVTVDCLFVVYKAAKIRLHDHNLTGKFIALKSVLLISIVQLTVCQELTMWHDNVLTNTEVQSVLAGFLFLCESLFLQLLFRNAFQIEEPELYEHAEKHLEYDPPKDVVVKHQPQEDNVELENEQQEI